MRYYGKIHSKLPIFRVKSVKIYTGQKKITRIYAWDPWQIWGMVTWSLGMEWKVKCLAKTNIFFVDGCDGFSLNISHRCKVMTRGVPLKVVPEFQNLKIYVELSLKTLGDLNSLIWQCILTLIKNAGNMVTEPKMNQKSWKSINRLETWGNNQIILGTSYSQLNFKY